MNQKLYDTDVTDVEWAILNLLIAAVQPDGRLRLRNMREIVKAIFCSLVRAYSCSHEAQR